MRVLSIVLDFFFLLGFFLISIFIFLPFSLVFYIWKWIVINILKAKNFGLAQLLDISYISKEQEFSQPQVIFDILITLEGQINYNDFVDNCAKNMLNLKEINNISIYKYPRLRQYPVKYLKYLFYKTDKNFAPRNHIRIEAEKSINQSNVYEYIICESLKPFKEKQSPWEIIIIPNYGGLNKSLIYLKIHHSVTDGFRVLQCLMSQGFHGPSIHDDLENLEVRANKYKELGNLSWKNFYYKTIGWPRYVCVQKHKKYSKDTSLCGERMSSHIRGQLCKLKNEKFVVLYQTKKIPTSLALQTIICGALNRFLKSVPTTKKNSFYINIPLPRPNRRKSNRVRNDLEFTNAHIQRPDDNLALELQNIQNQLVHQMKETSDSYSTLNNNIVKFLISPFTEDIKSHMSLQSIMLKNGPSLVNIKGPTQKVFMWNDNAVEDIEFWNLPCSSTQVVFSVMSYNGNVNISFTSCWKELWTNEHVQILRNELYNCAEAFFSL